jgi:hypothetical protein
LPRGGWKTEDARRIGRREVSSRSNGKLEAGGVKPDPSESPADSFTGLTVGAVERGGTSRVGEPEQFGPWQGDRGAAGSEAGAGLAGAGFVVAFAAAGPFRMMTWSPHSADARPGLKHATAATMTAARQPRLRGGRKEIIGSGQGAQDR